MKNGSVTRNGTSKVLISVLAAALMGCAGWIARPESDHLGRREWEQYALKRDEQHGMVKEDLSEIKAELVEIRREMSARVYAGPFGETP